MTSRRGFLIGIGAALAAPAIVKAESLMKIATMRQSLRGRMVTELFIYGTAWQVILDHDGKIKIIEHPAESVYVEAS